MVSLDICKHQSWSLQLEDDVEPADADGVPICDDCGKRLDTES